ncbi:acyl carrier protein [Natronosporangium hydrolyticum]|uniref:Acyl carrier protein n=1 Tax=Natronosporangium hydrolyticum TaxID=2811111 RepID=A0A895YIV7_9ACTN|nr:acyl carrier protein [Natronosporangium hydrolyticum]QSB15925.1 acyl carrier protein [Natronosporangium hydrolyticum]
MSREISLSDLRLILREAAGADEGVDLDADILDTAFADLGYDSLALLEASSRIERQFSVSLEESMLAEAATPREFLDVVNAHLDSAR